MAITIRTTPETLISKANDISARVNRIEKALKTIDQQIKNSRSYWEGDASNAHQKSYQGIMPDIQDTVKRLKHHPENLLQMAGLYRSTERELQAIAQTLPANPIE